MSAVHLEAQVMHPVGSLADLDRPAPKGRTLKVSRQAWHNILALAETQGFRFRGPDLFAVRDFAAALRAGLAQVRQPLPPGRGTRGSAKFTPANVLREYFSAAANVRELMKVVGLAEEGQRLLVTL